MIQETHKTRVLPSLGFGCLQYRGTFLVAFFVLGAVCSGTAALGTGWSVKCQNPPTFLGNPWAVLEVAPSGNCVYTDAQGEVTGEIPAETLTETAATLELASESLDKGDFGEPDVVFDGDKPQAFLFPGDYLCRSANSCDPDDKVVGDFIVGASGTGELYLAKDHQQTRTNAAHHEAFHSIESNFAGHQQEEAPKDWITEGMAEGFAETSARRHGIEYEEVPEGDRDFTLSLDLRGADPEKASDLAYGTGEFWNFVGEEASEGDYRFAHDILDQPDLGVDNGVEAVHRGLKKAGYENGLKDAYGRFVAQHLNEKKKDKLETRLELDVRQQTSDRKTHALGTIPPLASNGLILEVQADEGQKVELTIRFQGAGTSNPDTIVTVGDTIESSEFRSTHTMCGAESPIQHVVRVANLAFGDTEQITPSLEIEARVTDDDACACKLENLPFAAEVMAKAPKMPRAPRGYVRVDIAGKEVVMIDDQTRGSLFVTSVKVGERLHMGRQRYENFSATEGQVRALGMTPKIFSFRSPGEQVGSFKCREITDADRKKLFAPPVPEVRYCKVTVGDSRQGVSFTSTYGSLTIEQWDRDCWIAGNFTLFDGDGQKATGVFALDAGRSGIYDSRTKKSYRSDRYKSIGEIIEEATDVEELQREGEKAVARGGGPGD